LSETRSQSDRGRRGGLVGEFFAGFGLLFEAFRFLREARGLWGLASVPLALTLLALGTTATLLFANAAGIAEFVAAALPVVEVERAYEWIWLGPLKILLWLLAQILFLAISGVALLLSLMLANVVAAPFLDSLSYQVERIAEGGVIQTEATGLAAAMVDAGRSIKGEAQRLLFFLSLWLPLVLVGFIVPGLHIVTGPLSVLFAMLFLPLDFGGYTLDRRRVAFGERRHWVQANLPRMLGFGAAAFAACFVPGLNLLMVPVLVVAGTLLVVSAPPNSELDSL
jgi:uncharacterized protein involved in cysteine biosynthesis